jgi:PGF-pre-PGF domain-containing protein
MAVSKITISVKNSVNNIKLEITKVEQKPASITIEVSGNVYHYLEINKTNVKDTDVNNATIQFRVEKSWINVNNIDMNTIALHRFANNIWNKLSTTKVSEDTENVYYESISPGLSVFAISGETVSATTTLPTTTIPTTTTLPLISVKPSDIWIYLIILIVVISLVLFAVLKLRKKKHE